MTASRVFEACRLLKGSLALSASQSDCGKGEKGLLAWKAEEDRDGWMNRLDEMAGTKMITVHSALRRREGVKKKTTRRQKDRGRETKIRTLEPTIKPAYLAYLPTSGSFS